MNGNTDMIRDYVKTAASVNEARLRKPDRSVIRDLVGLISQDAAAADPDDMRAWDRHLGLNLGWYQNRITALRDMITRREPGPLSRHERAELRLMVKDAVDAFYYTLPSPASHHDAGDLDNPVFPQLWESSQMWPH
jgi:hypothetical protein